VTVAWTYAKWWADKLSLIKMRSSSVPAMPFTMMLLHTYSQKSQNVFADKTDKSKTRY
jgi:hypothetical protein